MIKCSSLCYVYCNTHHNLKTFFFKCEYIAGIAVCGLLFSPPTPPHPPPPHLSYYHHLSSEVKTWKERTLKREVHKEVTCENSPKSPKVTRTPSKKRHHISSQCKERNVQDPVPKESPKSWFFDNRSKSLPVPPPVRYFDNSGLGLCPGR